MLLRALLVYFTRSGFCRPASAVLCPPSSQQVCKLYYKQNNNVGQGWQSHWQDLMDLILLCVVLCSRALCLPQTPLHHEHGLVKERLAAGFRMCKHIPKELKPVRSSRRDRCSPFHERKLMSVQHATIHTTGQNSQVDNVSVAVIHKYLNCTCKVLNAGHEDQTFNRYQKRFW